MGPKAVEPRVRKEWEGHLYLETSRGKLVGPAGHSPVLKPWPRLKLDQCDFVDCGWGATASVLNSSRWRCNCIFLRRFDSLAASSTCC